MPIHWVKATNFPESATHAIDFGPGGLSGIGPLTARNLDGRGVRVVVVGDKAKGPAELYDAENVKFEEWWAKKFSPKLVKTMYVAQFWFTLRVLTIEMVAMARCTLTPPSLVYWASLRSWSLV